MILVKDARSDYSIVVAADASAAEKHAAEELQGFLEQATGCRLPIGAVGGEGRFIYVGCQPSLSGRGVGLGALELGADGFVVRAVGGDLVLVGGRPRGTLYAVYDFLEHEVGCRWFTPEVSLIPRRRTLAFTLPDRIERPAFEYREAFFKNVFDADWAARNRLNGRSYALDERRGGWLNPIAMHTFNALVPVEKYFKDHPEYFSLVDGRRRDAYGQLCLSNPDVLQIVTEKVMAQMDANPDQQTVIVGQNDAYGYCECEKCAALDSAEGTPAASMINFANKIAEATCRKHPDKLIATFAYQYTRRAPTTLRPHPNVAVTLCHLEGCCDGHPVESCPRNAPFLKDVKAWTAICDRVYVWDYYTDFAHYLMPHPAFDSYQPDLRLLAKHGVRGVFCQGNSASAIGSFNDLRAYLLARLLWNPDGDVDGLKEGFLGGVYAAAGGLVGGCVGVLQRPARRPEKHFGLFRDRGDGLYSEETLKEADALLVKAREIAGEDEVRSRVDACRLSTRYALLTLLLVHVVRDGRLEPEQSGRLQAPLDEFLAEVRRFRPRLSEQEPPEMGIERMEGLIRPHEILTLRSEHLEAQVVPGMDGRLFRLIDQRTGKDVLANRRGGGFDVEGGYGEYVIIADGPWTGRWVPMEVQGEVSETSVALAGRNVHLARYELRRSYRLSAGRPVLQITTEIIPEQMPLSRLVVMLPVAGGEEPVLECRCDDGSWELLDLKKWHDRLPPDKSPAGAWRVRGDFGTLEHRFEAEKIDFAIVALREEKHLVLQLSSLKTVGEGASFTFRQEIEVTPILKG